jgi:hypothetical protein
MAEQDTDEMICISGRWWSFPGAQIDGDSWEGEWRSDGQLRLRDSIGNTVEGRELSEAEVEQMARETLLADVLELAATKLRSGEGWDESTTTDVLNEGHTDLAVKIETAKDVILEIKHTYPEAMNV